jgi:hypothetical protein
MLQSLKSDENRQVTAVDHDSNSMYDVEELTAADTIPNLNDLSRETLTQVYNDYSFADRPQNSLPITAHREKVSKTYLIILQFFALDFFAHYVFWKHCLTVCVLSPEALYLLRDNFFRISK